MYIGDGLAIECTSRWDNGVQKTAVWNIAKRAGLNGRYWTKHGKLPWIQYSGQADHIEPEVIELGSRTIRKGTQGSDVIALQELLMRLGYSLPRFGADGDCGAETVAAITLFQEDQGLEADGKFGPQSYDALEKALAALVAPVSAPADPMEQKYTVTLHGVSQAEMDALRKRWPECEVVKE